jgi:glycosyltransferase involved in cell wall biosynthesis
MLLSRGQWPDARVEREASALADVGYEVTVLAWDRDEKRTEPLLGSGFRVEWFQAPTLRKGSILLGLPSYVSKMFRLGAKKKADIVHAHDLDTLPQALLISKMSGARLIYDSHEIYSKMVQEDIPKGIAPLLDCMETRLLRNCDIIFAANQSVADHLLEGAKSPVIVVMNAISVPERTEPVTAGQFGSLRIFYGGSFEPRRYIPELIEAVKRDDRLILRIAGKGRLEKEVVAASKQCARIQFLGYISQPQIVNETNSCDVVFSLLDPINENYRIATPVKLLEAMALGRPVIVSKGTISGDMVEKEGCGLAISWSPEEFRRAIDILLDPRVRGEMGAKGREAALHEYNWDIMRERLLQAYQSLNFLSSSP